MTCSLSSTSCLLKLPIKWKENTHLRRRLPLTCCLAMEPIVVSLLSNLYFLREGLAHLRKGYVYAWLLLKCLCISLAKCVEVRLIDNENKESNFFNMSLKTNITSEFSLQRTNLFFLHRIFQTMLIYTFANALVWLLSATWNVITRNDIWIHFRRIRMTCELSVRLYLPNKACKEPGDFSPVSLDHRIQNRSKITARAPVLTECHENSDLETSDPLGVSKTQTLLCYLIFAISSMARLGLFLFQQPRKQNFRTLLCAKWN